MSEKISRLAQVLFSLISCVALTSGCSQSQGSSASAHSASSAPRHVWRVNTAVGDVMLYADDLAEQSWIPIVKEASAKVVQVWQVHPGPVGVHVFSSDADFDSAVDDLDGQDVAATTEHGILLAPSASRALTHQGQVNVMTHEFTHWVLHQYGHDQTPLWVREGLAEWTAERDLSLAKKTLWPTLAKNVVSHKVPIVPPSAQTFMSNAPLSYETSTAAMEYLDHYGGIALIRRLSALHSGSDDAAWQLAQKSLKPGAPSLNLWLTSTLR